MRTRSLFALAAVSTLLLLAPPARAAVEDGAEAPDVGAEGYFNTEPVKMSELKGRLILLELFKTT